MKKKKMFISFMALVVLFAFAQMAMASYTINIQPGLYQTGSGGEFRIETLTGGLPWADSQYVSGPGGTKNQGFTPSFQTFCIEKTETFSYGEYRADIDPWAIQGGGGSVGGKDPLSWGTAYLYSQFASGTLAGYNYGANRTTSAAALQNAFWALENEIELTAQEVAANPFLSLIIGPELGKNYANLAAARQEDSNGQFGVMALNLYTENSARIDKQSQLVVVPIPAAAWLLGSGLIGLVVVRRRMKK